MGRSKRQRQEAAGYEAGIAQGLNGPQHGVCRLVSQLLVHDCGLPAMVVSHMHRLVLSLEFGCSLLQTRLLQCLSPQLAAASEGLVGQLPPEAAALPQPMPGQQQQQQSRGYQDQQVMEGVSSPIAWAAVRSTGWCASACCCRLQ